MSLILVLFFSKRIVFLLTLTRPQCLFLPVHIDTRQDKTRSLFLFVQQKKIFFSVNTVHDTFEEEY